MKGGVAVDEWKKEVTRGVQSEREREEEKRDRSTENSERDVRTKAESLKQLEESVVFFAARNEQLERRLCADRHDDTPTSRPFLKGWRASTRASRIGSTSGESERPRVYPRINGALTPSRRQRGVK